MSSAPGRAAGHLPCLVSPTITSQGWSIRGRAPLLRSSDEACEASARARLRDVGRECGRLNGPNAIAICIATRGRPTMLGGLLLSLTELRCPQSSSVDIVIIENEAAGEALRVVESMRSALPFRVHFDVEPEPNIARARNRAVAKALEIGATHLAFVDDDERVCVDWLEQLLARQVSSGASAVAGPIKGLAAEDCPRWPLYRRFFSTPPYRRKQLKTAGTCNLLVTAAVFHSLPWFDGRMGLSGGSDSLFTTRLHRTGGRIAWAPDAVVTEIVPSSRVNARWILARAFRVGETAVRCERYLEAELRRLKGRLILSTAHLGWGLMTFPLALVGGRTAALSSLWHVAYAAGVFSGLFRKPYLEYASVHGQ